MRGTCVCRRPATGNWSKLRETTPVRRYPGTEVALGHPPLTKSLLPTRHFQASLPRLPIPSLTSSLTQYLADLQPLLPPKEFDRTTALVKAFSQHEGEVLHHELVQTDKANKHTSYISSDWFEQRLRRRDPLPLHQYTTLLTRPDDDKEDMLVRAALWVSNSVRYYQLYLEDELRPDLFYRDASGFWTTDWFERTALHLPRFARTPFVRHASGGKMLPLDLSQNDNLFNSTRVPGVIQDEIKAVGFTPHIVVQYHGHQYVVTVADEDCNPLPVDQIYARLRAIVETRAAPPRLEIGILTSLPRAEWNAARTMLLREAVNHKSLQLVDEAMFVLNLDDDVHMDYFCAAGAMNKVHAVRCRNRWWDKSLSVNVTRNGFVSVGYEHSWGDGRCVRRYASEVSCATAALNGAEVRRDAAPTEALQQLSWKTSAALEQIAGRALKRLQADEKALDFHTVTLDNVTRLPEGRDALVHMATQLAWWRMNQSTVTSLEKVSLCAFRRGRRALVRPTSLASRKFTLSMSANSTVSDGVKAEQCRVAMNAYRNHKADVYRGRSEDTHLLALRNVSQRLFGREPELFRQPAYRTFSRATLLTQPLDSSILLHSGFNPVDDGYGVYYGIFNDMLLLSIASWSGAQGPLHTSEEFATELTKAIADVHDLLRH